MKKPLVPFLLLFHNQDRIKPDDWLGDVFIVKEEKANPDDKLDSEIETFCNTTNITREEDSLKWWAERESLFPCLSWVAKNIWQFQLQVCPLNGYFH